MMLMEKHITSSISWNSLEILTTSTQVQVRYQHLQAARVEMGETLNAGIDKISQVAG